MSVDTVKQTFQLLSRQRSRRPAADINGIQLLPGRYLSDKCQFLLQGIQIIPDSVLPVSQRTRAKGTVGTDRRAEGNPHIEAVAILAVQLPQQFPLPLRNRKRKLCFLAAHQKFPLKPWDELFSIPTFLRFLHGNLCGPDPRKDSPCKGAPCTLLKFMIKTSVNAIFQLTFLIFIPIIAGGFCGLFFTDGNPAGILRLFSCLAVGIICPIRQPHHKIMRGLLLRPDLNLLRRKESLHDMVHIIRIRITLTYHINHPDTPIYKNGLFFLSWPIIVSPICPG